MIAKKEVLITKCLVLFFFARFFAKRATLNAMQIINCFTRLSMQLLCNVICKQKMIVYQCFTLFLFAALFAEIYTFNNDYKFTKDPFAGMGGIAKELN